MSELPEAGFESTPPKCSAQNASAALRHLSRTVPRYPQSLTLALGRDPGVGSGKDLCRAAPPWRVFTIRTFVKERRVARMRIRTIGRLALLEKRRNWMLATSFRTASFARVRNFHC